MDDDYLRIVSNALSKLEVLHRQSEALNAEVFKLEQFISATANMLPDQQRELALRRMSVIQELSQIREVGLTDAIRSVLKSSGEEWLTVANIRDKLRSCGFDFTAYTSEPLASVSTTLKRLKSEEVEAKVMEGVTA